MFQKLQELFGRFHEGVEVYRCFYRPTLLNNDGLESIYASGRMKAKIDEKYRDYFEIELEKINGEWKLGYFYFPDYIDY